MADSAQPLTHARLAGLVLVALMIALAVSSLGLVVQVLSVQPAGIDFAPLWAGGKAALAEPGRLYDFDYISGLQGWPLGHDHPRPYVYPPSALLVFAPFALLPVWQSYWLWVLVTGAGFVWAGVKAGARWWFVLIPWVAFAAVCGQATFLLGALVLTGLAFADRRPILAGVAFGIAAALKPQLLILLPVALAAEGRWRTFLATGAAGLATCLAATAIWGLEPWRAWLAALPRFQEVVLQNPGLVRNALTPYAALAGRGVPPAWGYALAPLAAAWVWFAFRRRSDLADRLIALVGGALVITPYAMNYEMALLAPAVAIYLARTSDRRWLLYAAAALLQSRAFGTGLFTLLPALALPALRRLPLPGPSSNPNP